MRGIELRQLRYFSILAKELHFRKAAELAFVTQPALSQQISKLEETVGEALFTRDHGNVQLTASGIVLRDELETVFNQLDRALRLTRAAGQEREFRISIGMVEYTNLSFIPPAMIRLQARYPEIKINRHEMHAVAQMDALLKNDIDVGFGVPVGPLPADGSLSAHQLLCANWIVVMPQEHRLAGLEKLRIEDLAGERVVMFARSINPYLYDEVVKCCRENGFTPNFVYETTQAQVGISLVRQGLGIILGAAYVFQEVPANLTSRTVSNMPPLTVQAFSRSAENKPLILEFMELATEEAMRTQTILDENS